MTSAWTLNSSLQTTTESVGYSWSYDASGRVVQQAMHMDNTDYPVTYNYMASGCGCSKKDLQSITYPDGSQVNYVRDAIERVIGITPGYVSSMSYDSADGSVSSASYGSNGSAGTENFIKDSFGRLSWDLFTPQSYPYGSIVFARGILTFGTEVIAHEVLHKFLLSDSKIQSSLRIPVGADTTNIDKEFRRRCL
jgi:hypothetical protein